jgi:hypothetical protein
MYKKLDVSHIKDRLNNNNVWGLLEDGYDNINNHKVYYTLYERI